MIIPTKGRVLVKPFTKEEKTTSGIILPESDHKETPDQGEVVAVWGEDCVVKVGETVVFKKYAPEQIKFEDVEFLIIEEQDLLAVVEK